MKKIIVEHSSGNYPVTISHGALDNLSEQINKVDADKRFFIIDRNAFRFHKEKIRRVIRSFGKNNYFIVPSGESSKSYSLLAGIHKQLLKKHYNRSSLIIAIGGGVTGDLAGFTASTYMRGLRLIHVPTTVIAAADSSVGGKTGINFLGVKNVIGSFHQPEMVIIDPVFFNTLSSREYYSGAGELMKYAFLSGYGLFNDLLSNFDRIDQKDTAYIEKVIIASIKFKAAVTSRDVKEKGLRKILNLGHTFGHGFESASDFKIPHGSAVHLGLFCSLFLSEKLGIIDREMLSQLLELPLKLKPLPLFRKLDTADVYRAMLADKKSKEGHIKFVLIKEPGSILIDVKADKKDIIASVKDLKKLI